MSKIRKHDIFSIGWSKDLRKSAAREVASVAVMKDGKLLMGKRRDNGKWTMPGGHLNDGEHHHDGAVRELKEEAGIEVFNLKHLGSEDITDQKGNPIKVHSYKHEPIHDCPTTMSEDPDQEVHRWHWIDTKNGLPKEQAENLHSPKNVTLKLLGLQKSEHGWGHGPSPVSEKIKNISDLKVGQVHAVTVHHPEKKVGEKTVPAHKTKNHFRVLSTETNKTGHHAVGHYVHIDDHEKNLSAGKPFPLKFGDKKGVSDKVDFHHLEQQVKKATREDMIPNTGFKKSLNEKIKDLVDLVTEKRQLKKTNLAMEKIKKISDDVQSGLKLMHTERHWIKHVTQPGHEVRIDHAPGVIGKVIQGAKDPVNGHGHDRMTLVEHPHNNGKVHRWYPATSLTPHNPKDE